MIECWQAKDIAANAMLSIVDGLTVPPRLDFSVRIRPDTSDIALCIGLNGDEWQLAIAADNLRHPAQWWLDASRVAWQGLLDRARQVYPGSLRSASAPRPSRASGPPKSAS